MHLFDLPPEIREQIYGHVLLPANNRSDLADDYASYDFAAALVLYRINRQIYHEARKIFRESNTFVLIETPWEEAQKHVDREGHVPILVKGSKATKFDMHTLEVSINAPHYPYSHVDLNRFVILIDDLPKFTTSWKYSDLSHPGLNNHLSLTLKLRDPRPKNDWSEPNVPRVIQERLLQPFGLVKDLNELQVVGTPTPYTSLVKELRAEMAIPHDSPESCLRESTRLKDLGNAALTAGKPADAIELYRQAWLAMHIVIKGRQRHIHADVYFNRILVEEPYKGEQGHTVRLLLRVRLVANTVLAYLKLDMPAEAHFWGIRTINMLRQAIGLLPDQEASRAQDEAVLDFVAANEMGKIYYRTALASKALDEMSSARKLLKVAQVYLPHDKNIANEIGACALRLG